MLYDKFKQRLYPDRVATDNNGLTNAVEVLEAIYTDPAFPSRAPVLEQSLKESGKSRADLWSLAGIVAVEYGIETNNLKVALLHQKLLSLDVLLQCLDPTALPGSCHHQQGEAGCTIKLNSSLPFRTGRADCEPEDEARPYITSRHEAHPNPTGDGEDTVAFFRDNFGFRGDFKTIL